MTRPHGEVTGGGAGAWVPTATYRLQLHDGTSFTDAAELVDYLAALGVSDLYVSPIMTAPTGATHGYHILDPTRLDPQLGGRAGFERLGEALQAHNLGLLVDIVPNHLAASPDNPFWRSVLAQGPESPYAGWFDIDWDAGGGRLVLPILGQPLDVVIESGELEVRQAVSPAGTADAELVYHDTRLPLAGDSHDLGSVNHGHGTGQQGADPDGGVDPDEFGRLLDRQHYRLADWRAGTDEINYRRFFDITDLVGVRVEDPAVFRARHDLVLETVAAGVVTGLRIDHVDGLRDPLGYLRNLRTVAGTAAGTEDFYLVVEKILEGDEPLPGEWPVAGTTGYELANAATAVQIDTGGLERLGDSYRRLTGDTTPVTEALYRAKYEVLVDLFAGEVDRLTTAVHELSRGLPETPPIDPRALRGAIRAVTAALPVYRTYMRDDPDDDRPQPTARDRARLEQALATARRRDPQVDEHALVFLERVLGLDMPVGIGAGLRRHWLDAVVRWQQLTGPAMAKGFEDTTLYRHVRLTALNEVGADVDALTSPHGVEGFHERVARRAAHWPHAMNATSTHDTKRSEDVRARLAVLSEIPDVYAGCCERWFRRHDDLVREVEGRGTPDGGERWLAYQTLIGMWPLSQEPEVGIRGRLRDYMTKAIREAKRNTSWRDPNRPHERAVHDYVHAMFDDAGFLDQVRSLVERIALPGAVNSLAQLVLKLAVPGVPDIYQGTELWDFSLVDPDNRRPVDWTRRREDLDEIVRRSGIDHTDGDRTELLTELREHWRDGRLKLFVTWAGLRARRQHPDLLRDGDYLPLEPTGEHADHVIAFARRGDDAMAVIVVPRLPFGLADGWPVGEIWGDTRIRFPVADVVGSVDVGPLDNRLVGDHVPVIDGWVRLRDVFRQLPVAVLLRPPG